MPMTRVEIEVIIDHEDGVEFEQIADGLRRALAGTTIITERAKTLAMIDEVEGISTQGLGRV